MKKTFVTITALLIVAMAHAQFTYDYLKAADQYYRKADYSSASEYYEKYLATRKSKMVIRPASYSPYSNIAPSKRKAVPVSSEQQAIYQLAESYRLLHNYEKAAPWYQEALEFDKQQFPLAPYHYATSLRALAKYEEAEKAFSYFLNEYKKTDDYRKAAEREVQNLRFIQEQLARKDLHLYKVHREPASLNTTGASYAPVWLNNGVLVFTSTRPDSAAKDHIHTNRIYQTSYTAGAGSQIARLNVPQPRDAHQGVISAMPGGNTMFLTRWKVVNGKKVSSIYTSKKNGEVWSDPVALDTVVNKSGFSAQQPFVMDGGKYLLFASNRPGGRGGLDLWYAEMDANGKPLRAGNLGSTVNTVYDEQAPYFHAPSGTLVFSGNGRTGMGGFDFFFSKGNIDSWAEPVNFGYPVNSVKDDIYFTSNDLSRNILEDVWMSSDRDAECCLELFTLQKMRPAKTISGLVVDCDGKRPVAGAQVNVVDTVNNRVLLSKTTGPDGSYSFTVDEYLPLKASASSDGYTPASLQVQAPVNMDTAGITAPELCLVKTWPPPVETPVVLDNVYYDFNVATLREASYPMLDKLVDLMKEYPSMVIEISAHTDSKGADPYNQHLSEARGLSCVSYLISKGIEKQRLQHKGYAATKPVAPNELPDGTDNPDGRQENRRTEFKILRK